MAKTTSKKTPSKKTASASGKAGKAAKAKTAGRAPAKAAPKAAPKTAKAQKAPKAAPKAPKAAPKAKKPDLREQALGSAMRSLDERARAAEKKAMAAEKRAKALQTKLAKEAEAKAAALEKAARAATKPPKDPMAKKTTKSKKTTKKPSKKTASKKPAATKPKKAKKTTAKKTAAKKPAAAPKAAPKKAKKAKKPAAPKAPPAAEPTKKGKKKGKKKTPSLKQVLSTAKPVKKPKKTNKKTGKKTGGGPKQSKALVRELAFTTASGRKEKALLITPNPELSVGEIVVAGVTFAIALVAVSAADRAVATWGPKGGRRWTNGDAMTRILAKPDAKRYGVIAGIAVVSGVGAAFAAKKGVKYVSPILGAITIAAVAYGVKQALEHEVMPRIFKTDGQDGKIGGSLYIIEQIPVQDEIAKFVKEQNDLGLKHPGQAEKLPDAYNFSKGGLPIGYNTVPPEGKTTEGLPAGTRPLAGTPGKKNAVGKPCCDDCAKKGNSVGCGCGGGRPMSPEVEEAVRRAAAEGRVAGVPQAETPAPEAESAPSTVEGTPSAETPSDPSNGGGAPASPVVPRLSR